MTNVARHLRTHLFEQAFSDDGGKTWEVNWKATFTKVSDDGQENRDDAPR